MPGRRDAPAPACLLVTTCFRCVALLDRAERAQPFAPRVNASDASSGAGTASLRARVGRAAPTSRTQMQRDGRARARECPEGPPWLLLSRVRGDLARNAWRACMLRSARHQCVRMCMCYGTWVSLAYVLHAQEAGERALGLRTHVEQGSGDGVASGQEALTCQRARKEGKGGGGGGGGRWCALAWLGFTRHI